MDLFGPTRSMSLSGKRYGYVLMDDFSRFTWVFFLLINMKLLVNFRYSTEKLNRMANINFKYSI